MVSEQTDMTPQVARIDAHVRPIEGCSSLLLCRYSPSYKTAKFQCNTRSIQLGAELYGHDSIEADVEMIDVMLGLLEKQIVYKVFT